MSADRKVFGFDYGYGLLFLAVLVVEASIAIFVHDRIVRPFIGDMLVVVLVYAFFRMWCRIGYGKAVAYVFIFAVGVEILQALHLVNFLGLQRNVLARTILGTSFSWTDILMYATGACAVLVGERLNASDRQ